MQVYGQVVTGEPDAMKVASPVRRGVIEKVPLGNSSVTYPTMVCGDTFQDVRVQHRGHVVDNVIEGAYSVLENFDRVSESRAAMAAISLSEEEQRVFANAALPLRFSESEEKPKTDYVLRPRRAVDKARDLWTTFNVVQENLVKGGIPRITSKGNIAKTRKINGIDGNVRLNKALWTLAEAMRAIKQAA